MEFGGAPGFLAFTHLRYTSEHSHVINVGVPPAIFWLLLYRKISDCEVVVILEQSRATGAVERDTV